MSLSLDVLHKIEGLARDVCQREGCVLYDVEFISGSKGKGRVLRVYVDKTDQPAGVDDCEKVSRGMSLILDVEDVIPGGEYSLEVSTPGLERNLRKPFHFQQAQGKAIQIRTNESIYDYNPEYSGNVKRMNAKGLLESAGETEIVIVVDDMKLTVPYQIIDKAHIIYDFESSKGKKK